MVRTSTDNPRGHAWRVLCAQAKVALPWICARCGAEIERNPADPQMAWSGGHKVALANGGPRHGLTLTDIQPEHARCNKQAQANDAAASWRSRAW